MRVDYNDRLGGKIGTIFFIFFHIHTDITTCNIEEAQQKYRPGTVSNRFLGWGLGSLNIFTGSKPSPFALCFCSESKELVRLKVSLPINKSTRETTNHG